jgi:Tol biopolymer transport system component
VSAAPYGRAVNRMTLGLALAALVLTTSSSAAPVESRLVAYAAFTVAVGDAVTPEVAADLFVSTPAGERMRRLTRTPEWESDPAWSRDGRTIAFTRRSLVCHASECFLPTDDASLHTIPAAGGRSFRLTYDDTYALESSPSWSADGRRIAFVRDYSEPGPGIMPGIYVVGTDGQGVRRIVAGWIRSVDYSPDGATLAFVTGVGPRYVSQSFEAGTQTLRGVDLRTGRGARLAVRGITGTGTDVDWAPGGESLAVATTTGAFVVPAGGGMARRVGRGSYDAVSWTADGRVLALGEPVPESDWVGDQAHISITRRDGTGSIRIAPRRGSQFSPDWRP